MRLPRRVPWSSTADLEQLCSWIYSEEADHDSRLRAIHRLSAWRAITYLPHALESTLSLLVVTVQDTTHTNSLLLRQAYAAALLRLVNGFVDPLQLGTYARSIASIAHQLGLPQWLVELRHAATHEELPSLELLREAAEETKTWLLHNYFLPTLNPSSAVNHLNTQPLQPLAPLLKQYKALVKITVRDVSSASTHKPAITALIKDIERWVSEAKVVANLAAGDFGWENGKGFDRLNIDDHETDRWALDKLCAGLLEKGALVPLSKKKRLLPADTYAPPTMSVQIWSPLLHSLQKLHPDLPSILCSNIVAYLTGGGTDKVDSTFAACLARWLFWLVEKWESAGAQEHEQSLKKEVVVTLMQALGHAMSEPHKNVAEARGLLLELCDARQEWQAPLALLLQPPGVTANTKWVADDVDLMDQRLATLQSFADTSDKDKQDGDVNSIDAHPSIVAGWRQLSDAEWRPCPIGTHYPVHSP
ncbi:Las1-like domain containing protein [Amanita muscaria]